MNSCVYGAVAVIPFQKFVPTKPPDSPKLLGIRGRSQNQLSDRELRWVPTEFDKVPWKISKKKAKDRKKASPMVSVPLANEENGTLA